MLDILIDYIYIIPAALIAIMLHEIAHGLVSYWLGDPTPKRQGRLSLNPAKHLDPLGTVCLIFFHVGWAKPVMVNPEYYKNKKWGMALVALAGPVTNFILSVVSIFIFGFIIKLTYTMDSVPMALEILLNFFQYLAIINLGLGIFNLIPIPPLDGSKILGAFLSDRAYDMYMKIQRYGFWLLAGFLILSSMYGSGISFVSVLVEKIFYFLLRMVLMIFGLI